MSDGRKFWITLVLFVIGMAWAIHFYDVHGPQQPVAAGGASQHQECHDDHANPVCDRVQEVQAP